MKREVWARDGGCCTYVSEDGRRCASTRFLEYDHIELKTHGGAETADNLRLRCRAHNRLTAEQALGEAHMALAAQGFRPVPRAAAGEPTGSAGGTGEEERRFDPGLAEGAETGLEDREPAERRDR